MPFIMIGSVACLLFGGVFIISAILTPDERLRQHHLTRFFIFVAAAVVLAALSRMEENILKAFNL